ncbi:hypothetical protein [Fusobacterium ulcerans]|uniref:hypothetical protein n=1 Tax=Fusobacterium ulcerans TaxID=861 RepID=UPI001D0A63BD|nr:hypothetical protein [Fusobacterium ulcerans]MCB8566295.1 hypothetical protein [Fusobacterium ulcerans]MCB8650402.1 hypothetical protein [Fusobacterium ulcerans]
MIFNTYEWKESYDYSLLMKGLVLLKAKFEYYKLREGMIQKVHYYTENVDGHWITFPIIVEKHRAYFCPVLITPWNNEVYKRLDELQKKFLIRINMIPELKDKFIIK